MMQLFVTIQLLLISLLFGSCKGSTTQIAKAEAITYSVQMKQVKSDTLLVNIQGKITDTFIQSLLAKDNNKLLKLGNTLDELHKSKKQNIIVYWQSYLQFYSSIYYLKSGDKNKAEKEIDKGINWLNEMKNKNSEDYALLAMLQGFGIQFYVYLENSYKSIFISEEI